LKELNSLIADYVAIRYGLEFDGGFRRCA